MKPSRTVIVSGLFVLIAVVVGLWAYPRLPALVPTHWDLHGQPTRWTPRFWSAFLPAMLLVGTALLAALLPRIAPRQFDSPSSVRVFDIAMLATQAAVLVIDLAILLGSAGHPMPVVPIALVALGVLFMVIGNYMGKLRRNAFFGIRTPWTLSSDAVWERTHRIGGWVMLLGGLGAVIGALAGAPHWLPVGLLVLAGLAPVAYSYWIHRELASRD